MAHTPVHRRGIGDVWEMLQGRSLPVAAGAEVVPKKIHGLTGYNVAARSRPHSVISAPAVLLDRVQNKRHPERTPRETGRGSSPTRMDRNAVADYR